MRFYHSEHSTPAPEYITSLPQLVQYRAELRKTKAKHTLTDTDANLLATHATELHYEDGQMIVEERNDITSLYRIKSGMVDVYRNGYQYERLSKGWFIGDILLLYDTHHVIRATMRANGPVVLEELNVSFVKQLFKIDVPLAVKFLRHIAMKYAYTFQQILTDLAHPSLQVPGTPGATWWSSDISNIDVSSSDTFTTSSSSSDSDSLSSSTSSIPSPSLSSAAPLSTPSAPSSNRNSCKLRPQPTPSYKVYPLAATGNGIQFLHLKQKKIKVVSKSFGFSFKTEIELSKILSINKNSGENAVTLIYQPRKVATIFFKNFYDREEFLSLLTSLTTVAPPSPSVPRGQVLTVPHNPNTSDYDVVPLCGGKEAFCRTIQSRLSLKKGERVFEEGDLYQRVFTLVKGSCYVIQKGRVVATLDEGEIIGVGSLVYLRPSSITVEVCSETAELVMIPAYKMNALIETDIEQAQHLYLHTARALEKKIGKILGYLPKKKEEGLGESGEVEAIGGGGGGGGGGERGERGNSKMSVVVGEESWSQQSKVFDV